MSDIKLSVLIAGIPERLPCTVLADLCRQATGKPVQLVYLLDNRVASVGDKRSDLLAMARGEYVAFVDDDDSVATDYVERLLVAIDSHPVDVITFRQDCKRGDLGGRVEHCRYGLELEYQNGQLPDGSLWWTGKPAHTMLWRRELVAGLEFPDGDFGEDTGWVAQACQLAKTEYEIAGWTGYYYNFNQAGSRTRGL